MKEKKQLREIFDKKINIEGNLIFFEEETAKSKNQEQVGESYSFQWEWVSNIQEKNKAHDMQKKWYLDLYGFKNDDDLSAFLSDKNIILDAGCGLGYKAAWFAELAPKSIVIGMDYSTSVFYAAKEYQNLENLFFIQADIAATGLKNGVVDYVSCDQVLQHTENPEKTFAHLAYVTTLGQFFSCYVYAKKALPRELLDDYFRTATHDLEREDIVKMSKQLTMLGKILSDLKIEIDFPDIPLLGIKGGRQDLQRFIYWNFIKCFWNEDLGIDISDTTNFDWYSPSNAKRYSESEYKKLVNANGLSIDYFHSEEACYSGRFLKLS